MGGALRLEALGVAVGRRYTRWCERFVREDDSTSSSPSRSPTHPRRDTTMTLFLSILIATLWLLILQTIFTRLYRRYSTRKFFIKNSCAAPRTLHSVDIFFGLDTFFRSVNSLRNHCRMKVIQQQTQIYGHTFQAYPLGRRTLTTVNARNIQAVLSLQHEKFAVQPIRGPAEAMMGPGIISNDGKVWEHARAMIRPAFTRKEIADREMFDLHFERFLSLLPEEGEVVDLQPLFDRLVWLDVSSSL